MLCNVCTQWDKKKQNKVLDNPESLCRTDIKINSRHNLVYRPKITTNISFLYRNHEFFIRTFHRLVEIFGTQNHLAIYSHNMSKRDHIYSFRWKSTIWFIRTVIYLIHSTIYHHREWNTLSTTPLSIYTT